MRFSTRKRRQPPAVIVINLIDVLIVLLIFLMVTTTFKDSPSLRITLPESRTADARPGASENPPLIVTVTTNEPWLYLGKTPVTLDRLETELTEKVKESPGIPMAIRADTEAPYGRVVQVTEAAKVARIREIKAYLKPAMKP